MQPQVDGGAKGIVGAVVGDTQAPAIYETWNTLEHVRAGVVTVRHIPGDTNPADMFTKILPRPTFEKHRKFVMNLAGDTGVEYARRQRMTVSSRSSATSAT